MEEERRGKSRVMFHRQIPHIREAIGSHELFEARFKRFLKDIEAYEQKYIFERTLDAFLDLYSIWKKTKERPLKLRLVMLAFELHRLNRDFQCELFFKDAAPCERSWSGT